MNCLVYINGVGNLKGSLFMIKYMAAILEQKSPRTGITCIIGLRYDYKRFFEKHFSFEIFNFSIHLFTLPCYQFGLLNVA